MLTDVYSVYRLYYNIDKCCILVLQNRQIYAIQENYTLHQSLFVLNFRQHMHKENICKSNSFTFSRLFHIEKKIKKIRSWLGSVPQSRILFYSRALMVEAKACIFVRPSNMRKSIFKRTFYFFFALLLYVFYYFISFLQRNDAASFTMNLRQEYFRLRL